jgi:DNA-binding LytR/AlgR family response regulator
MSVTLNTLIVEDEPLAREGLQMYVREIGFLDVKEICEDALAANRALAIHKIDLMFLDIQMPKLTGLDFLKSITNPPMVILTTAYPNFALQGFEMDVIDYLVKPYGFNRFIKAVNKARDFFELRSRPAQSANDDFFFVKVDYRYEKIEYKDVLYIEGMENYVVIHTADQKYVTLMRMKNIEEMLPAATFIRTHKSYIVSRKAITAIDGNDIVIGKRHGGDVRLPMSKEKKAMILDKLIQ